MSRFTEQTDGAKLHNETQIADRRARDAAILEGFEKVGMSVRMYAPTIGVSPQRLSVVLRRARADREART